MSVNNNPYRPQGFSPGEVKPLGVVRANVVGDHPLRANGMILRGVVVTTYVPADEQAFDAALITRPTAVYCDVLTYGTRATVRGAMIYRALVADSVGLHNGHVWIPRAAKVDVSPAALNVATADPRNLDGDHVLVQFLEDNFAKPVITGRVPHPRADLGNDGLSGPAGEAGHRTRLKVADGNPEFWKNNGTFFGVDGNGHFVVDTTRAHADSYDEDGAETPADSAEHGDVTFRVNHKCAFKVVGLTPAGDTPKFLVTMEDGKIDISLDDADAHVIVENDKITASLNGGTDAVLTLEKSKLKAVLNSSDAEMDLEKDKLSVKFGADAFVIDGSGPNATLTLGTGAKYGMVWDMFDTWATAVLAAMKSSLAGHIHTAIAPGAATTPSTNWAGVFAAVDTADAAARPAIKAGKVKIPYP